MDLAPQRHYPFEFHQSDALAFIAEHGQEFDAIHASPPCQAYSITRLIWRDRGGREHPRLVEPVRELLLSLGKPYIIENTPGAPLIDPHVLCGTMFPELRVLRHRLFETSFPYAPPTHPEHPEERMAKVGRPVPEHGRMVVAGHFSDVKAARRAMGISWMSRDELAQAIPPAYTHHIGHQLYDLLTLRDGGLA